MPLIENSTYRPKKRFKNMHFNTIYTALCRKVVDTPKPEKERLELKDGDFLDLIWFKQPIKQQEKIVICVHGLEGNAQKPYMRGMMKRFFSEGYDSIGINMRSCSHEDNRLLTGYHSGNTADLAAVVNHVLSQKYQSIVLVGFSVGGNICLKYTGEQGENIPSLIQKVIAFSVPIHFRSSAIELEKRSNAFYQWQFLVTLKWKVRGKRERFGQYFDWQEVRKAKTFRSYDNAFTAKIHGFGTAENYWEKVSSLYHIENIRVPTLLVNAKDDSFLAKESFPIDLARKSDYFYLEMPEYGGHVGFGATEENGFYWSENRAWEFVCSGK